MELIDAIRQIAKVYTDSKDKILTEEATKTALIMPFMAALGYNVFDPSEVIPEFTAEFGAGNGKKVDYAIAKDGNPIMLIEAKWCGATLDVSKEAQLLYYFNATTSVSVGILTNGVEYRFYMDLDKENVMDERPFLQFNINDITDHIARELKKFAKSAFSIDEVVYAAEELKYTGAMKAHLSEQLAEPCDDFVRYMTKQVFSGIITEKVRDKFKNITKKAFSQFISDRVSDRLAAALSETEKAATPPEEPTVPVDDAKSKIVTGQDEIEGYNIVKAVLRQKVDAKRIIMKDTVNYCSVLLDNTRRSLCRFYFNNPERKMLVTFDAERKEVRHQISEIDEIYNYSNELFVTLDGYLQGKPTEESTEEAH